MSEPGTVTHLFMAIVSGVSALLAALLTYIFGVVGLKDKFAREIHLKIQKMQDECENKIQKSQDTCVLCRKECAMLREKDQNKVAEEIKSLDDKLVKGDKQFTYIRMILENVICEELKIPDEKIRKIQQIAGIGPSPVR